MKKNIRGALSELGYNMDLKGAKYTEGAVYQMLCFINSEEEKNMVKNEIIASRKEIDQNLTISEEEITNEVLVSEMLGRVHVEAYHFEYEIGRKLYFARVNQFLTSNNEEGQRIHDLEHYDCGGEIDEREVNSMLMGLVNFFNAEKDLVFESSEEQLVENKVNFNTEGAYVKKYNSMSNNCAI